MFVMGTHLSQSKIFIVAIGPHSSYSKIFMFVMGTHLSQSKIFIVAIGPHSSYSINIYVCNGYTFESI